MADRDLDAAIALTRFGLGARPGELAAVRSDPRGWLKGQIRPEGADQPRTDGATSRRRIAEFREYRQDKEAAKADGQPRSGEAVPASRDPVKMAQRMLRQETGGDTASPPATGSTGNPRLCLRRAMMNEVTGQASGAKPLMACRTQGQQSFAE